MKIISLLLILFTLQHIQATQHDAAIDRNFIFPDAKTVKQYQVTLNNYEIMFSGISFGITDSLQLSVTAGPLGSRESAITMITLKKRVLNRSGHQLSLLAGGSAQPSAKSTVVDSLKERSGMIGAVLYSYTSKSERFRFSSGFFLVQNLSEEKNDPFFTAIESGISYRISKYFKYLMEFALLSGRDSDEDHPSDGIFREILSCGFRLTTEYISFDLGFFADLSHPLFVPLLNINIRF